MLRLVPGGGVEPPRSEDRRILSPLRLPVPPSRLDSLATMLQQSSTDGTPTRSSAADSLAQLG